MHYTSSYQLDLVRRIRDLLIMKVIFNRLNYSFQAAFFFLCFFKKINFRSSSLHHGAHSSVCHGILTYNSIEVICFNDLLIYYKRLTRIN